METAVFLIFALLALVSGVAVVANRNPVHATMSLVVTLFSLAVLFVMLGAPFLGALQVLVYAGAILVLFLFVIMLLNVQREEHREPGQPVQRWVALLAAGAFAGLFLPLLYRTSNARTAPPLTEESVSISGVARELYTTYLLHFEIVGLLLLVAVIAATVVARKPPSALSEDGDSKEIEDPSEDRPAEFVASAGSESHS